MSAARKPWAKLSAVDRIEAIRPLEAAGRANSTICFDLKAPRAEVDRICAFLRKERHAHAAATAITDQPAMGGGDVDRSAARASSAVEVGAPVSPEGAPQSQSGGADVVLSSAPSLGALPAGRDSDESPASNTQGKPLRPVDRPEAHSRDRAGLPADSRAGDRHEITPESEARGGGGGNPAVPAREDYRPDEFPSGGDAFAAVKGKAQLADAAGVEPPPSDPMPATSSRQATAPSTRTSSPEPMANPERATSSPSAPATLPTAPDRSIPWSALDARQKEAAVLPMAKRGFSARAIAEKLGLDSRNQVVGVIQRLQKSGHLPPPMSRVTAQRSVKRATPSKPSRLLAILPGGGPKTNQYDFRQRAVDRAASRGLDAHIVSGEPRRPIALEAPVSRRLTLLDLTDQTCRWPHGDPRREDFSFCGNATVAAPYCPYHAQIAFVPVAERRARRQLEERIN